MNFALVRLVVVIGTFGLLALSFSLAAAHHAGMFSACAL